MRAAFVTGLLLVASAPVDAQPGRARERYHAYWLTRHPPTKDGSSEYLELMVTRLPIDRLAAEAAGLGFLFDNGAGRQPPLLDAPAIVMATYGKDSVWNGDGTPLKYVRSVADHRPQERLIAVNGKQFRYDPCPIADVVRLLERPEGTRPIHRIHAPLVGYEQTALALSLLLREQLRAEAKQ